MHNDRMRLLPRLTGAPAALGPTQRSAHMSALLLALSLALSLVLSGCTGDDGGSSQQSSESDSSPSPSASETPYLEVPAGVELTAQGSELEVGERATVAYEPRQNAVGALEIRVTGLERATFRLFEGFEITKDTLTTSPYFVRARVTNVGATNLGGRPVPLYIVDQDNRLIESSVFAGTFRPCSGSVFPDRFGRGDTMKACLVYLAPDKGDLTAVSFRPDQKFDPITWEGKVAPVGKAGGDKADDGPKPDAKRGGPKQDG